MKLMLVLLVFLAATSAIAQPKTKVQARLISEDKTVAPGATVTIALQEIIADGWHTYWENPGDAGAPTQIDWSLPPGWHAGPIQWPYPQRLPVGPLMDYGYEGKVWLLDQLHAPTDLKSGQKATLKAQVSWLVCKNICIPENSVLALTFDIDTTQPDRALAKDFAAARARLPIPSPWKVNYAQNHGLDLFIAAPSLAAARPTDVEFFPQDSKIITNAAPQPIGYAQNGIMLKLAPAGKLQTLLKGVVVLTSKDGSVQAIQISAPSGAVPQADFSAAETSVLSLWVAAIFAFIGGLILNVMPCVLPILAMKALAISRHGSHGAAESFTYAAGAILSFLVLGIAILILRGSGQAVGWGFQLQSPIAVGGFALLLFAVGLSLSGVFEVSSITAGEQFARRSGLSGTFFTGVLAVAVAAPCTAPFMAASLGFGLTQSVPIALSIFIALGLGFSAPFLLLGFWPRLLRFIPKPGAWTLRLKEFLAFPMYGAGAWLGWVLAQQSGPRGIGLLLSSCIALALAAWLWSLARRLSLTGRWVGSVLALLVLLASFYSLALLGNTTAKAPAVETNKGQIYSAAKLAAYRAQDRPVFIDATAAWCVTCLVNEDAVLSRLDVQSAFKAHNVIYMIADWTRQDPQITALLKDNGRAGVPLYLYYAPGAKSPVVLPQILTESTVLSVLSG